MKNIGIKTVFKFVLFVFSIAFLLLSGSVIKKTVSNTYNLGSIDYARHDIEDIEYS